MESKNPASQQWLALSKGKYDTFIFDVDGTLLDTLPDLVLLTNAVLRESGYPERTQREILGFVGNGVKALMYQAVPTGISEVEVEEAMCRWKNLYPHYGHDLTKPYQGIVAMLDELKAKGMKLAALSNKFDAGVQDVIATYLPNTFAAVHGECAEYPRKPDPTGLLRTVEELSSTPERTVYVGDSVGDIVASRNASTAAIGVAWGYHQRARLEEANPDVILEHPQELLFLV